MNNKYLNLIACALLGCGAAHAAPAPYFITDIGVLELPTPGAADSMALDINDKGEIVGWFKTVNDVKHAFLYRQGLMEDITFGTFSQAEAAAEFPDGELAPADVARIRVSNERMCIGRRP